MLGGDSMNSQARIKGGHSPDKQLPRIMDKLD